MILPDHMIQYDNMIQQFVEDDAVLSNILPSGFAVGPQHFGRRLCIPLPLGKGKLVGVLERSEGIGFVLIILIKQISRTGFKNMAK